MLRARGIALLVTTFALASGSVALAPAAFAAAPAASISIDVSPDEATEGDTLEVTVTSTGTSDLYAYDLIFTYDPAVLEFDEDSAVGPDGGFTTGALGDGLIAVTHTRLGTSPGLTGAVELASFSFRAIDGGDTEIALASAELVSSTDETRSPVPRPIAPPLGKHPDRVRTFAPAPSRRPASTSRRQSLRSVVREAPSR